MNAIVLEKLFARKRPLAYFYTWNGSDREGLREYLGKNITHNLFIVDASGSGEVWYAKEELARLCQEAKDAVNSDKTLQQRIIAHTREKWTIIGPYLKNEKVLQTGKEVWDFFRALTEFWYGMNTILFRIPDLPDIDPDYKAEIYKIRNETQEYSERMGQLFAEFIENKFPQYASFAYIIAPEEYPLLDSGVPEEILAKWTQRRDVGCCLLDDKLRLLSELPAEMKLLGLEYERADANINEVRGAIGFKGIVRGRAIVIKTKMELGHVETGDIIVSALTDPDYVPAMIKSAGFVTDEGGIMSHAAITAREMKKPCVIGTKFATQIFKNGDMIEVDAEKGIARKI